jgi:hypothetical protein
MPWHALEDVGGLMASLDPDHLGPVLAVLRHAGPGSSSRCSPSMTVRSHPRTDPNQATGNLNAVVKRQ